MKTTGDYCKVMAQDFFIFYCLKCVNLQYTSGEVTCIRKSVYILLKDLLDGEWQWEVDGIKIIRGISKKYMEAYWYGP